MTNPTTAVDLTVCANARTLKPLARATFDALLEQDLLGVLLSGTHLRLALCKLNLLKHQATAASLAADEEASAAFHLLMLEMFSGIYIQECLHDSKEALMADLDGKCQHWLSSTKCDQPTNQAHEIAVDLIRQYRNTCACTCSQGLASHAR